MKARLLSHEEVSKDQRRRLRSSFGKRDLQLILTPRFLAGLALVISAIFGAILINTSAEQRTSLWSSTQALAPGEIIDGSKIREVGVDMGSETEFYFPATESIIGKSITRPIGLGELIPQGALSDLKDEQMRKVAVSLPSSTLPFGLQSGESVDLYTIPSQQNSFSQSVDALGRRSAEPLLMKIGISGIETGVRDIGGNSTITFLVAEDDVEVLLTAMIDRQIMVVRH